MNKEVDCEYFLCSSKKYSVLIERRSRGRLIECVRPDDPKTCGVKKRYEW